MGGCLFTILSLIIPPLLHLICFKKTITKAEKAKDIACCVGFFIFMVISTIYSAITLIEGLKKWCVCHKQSRTHTLHSSASLSSSFEMNGLLIDWIITEPHSGHSAAMIASSSACSLSRSSWSFCDRLPALSPRNFVCSSFTFAFSAAVRWLLIYASRAAASPTSRVRQSAWKAWEQGNR